MDFQIRRALPEDATALGTLRRAAVAELCRTHYSPEQIEPWAGSGAIDPAPYETVIADHWVSVAVVGQRVVGFVTLLVEEGRIGALYIDPEFARLGVGSRLYCEAEARAREAGLERLSLMASLNSVPFYEACGFERLGQCTESLRHVTLECMSMEKSLRPSDS